MYALILRRDMSLVCKFNDLTTLLEEQTCPPFFTVDLTDSQGFNQFTDYELSLLYKNMGSVMGTVLNQRASLIASLLKLLQYKPLGIPAQMGIFAEIPTDEADDTGHDRSLHGATPLARTGQVRDTVWKHADIVWTAAGKPIDVKVILQLRKQMMAELEVQGIKKSTSSNELGSWMKVVLNNKVAA